MVDTIGFNDRTWIDISGYPHTEALHTTERFTRPDFGHMDLTVMIDDPKAYTKPWTPALHFQLLADHEMIEEICDNERDAVHMVGRNAAHFSAFVWRIAIQRARAPSGNQFRARPRCRRHRPADLAGHARSLFISRMVRKLNPPESSDLVSGGSQANQEVRSHVDLRWRGQSAAEVLRKVCRSLGREDVRC